MSQQEMMMDLDATGHDFRNMTSAQIDEAHDELMKKKSHDEYLASEEAARKDRKPAPNGDIGSSPSM